MPPLAEGHWVDPTLYSKQYFVYASYLVRVVSDRSKLRETIPARDQHLLCCQQRAPTPTWRNFVATLSALCEFPGVYTNIFHVWVQTLSEKIQWEPWNLSSTLNTNIMKKIKMHLILERWEECFLTCYF
ncbi:hypothetical protein ABEB36_002763 [Hypothenemus hampei]|uniref:Uncharacterized protein n=1 Tax=Hypothenemus hampei TaxID=57062 RepID=A0ABD1F6W0_HYPHA